MLLIFIRKGARWRPSLVAGLFAAVVSVGSAAAFEPNEAGYHMRRVQADLVDGEHKRAYGRLRWLLQNDLDSAARSFVYQNVLQDVRNDHPLSFGATAALVPSTNIERTSSEDRFLYFPLDEAENGVSLSIGAYASAGHAYAPGREITLRADAQRTLSHVDEIIATTRSLSLTHSWLSAGQASHLSVFGSDTDYLDLDTRSRSPDYTRYGLRFGHNRALTPRRSLSFGASLTENIYEERDYLDGTVLRLDAGMTQSLDHRDWLSFSGAVETADLENPTYSYKSLTLGTTYGRTMENGLSWSLGYARTWRDYDRDFFPLRYARSDLVNDVTIGLSHERITVREMRPKLSCTFRRHGSNIALYDYETVDCSVSMSYAF